MSESEREQRALRRRFETSVRRFVKDHTLLPADGRLLVAVSGGADSTALLLVLSTMAKRGALSLAVAHFDHGLRGREVAGQEEQVVRELALSLGLPFFSGRGDVTGRAKAERRSVEETARIERYAFLAEAAREAGSSAVATGHTASDQAETVLMHIMRGAGLAGLAGIAPRSAWPFSGHEGLTLVRPLLRVARADTVAYCAANGVEPVDDETNAWPEYQRNRVRHQLMPSLRGFNPDVEGALVRLADAARGDIEFLDSVAATAITATDDAAHLSRTLLESWTASPRRHALRLAVMRLLGDSQDFSERHVLALERLVLAGQTGDHLDLPRGIVAELTRQALELGRPSSASVRLPDGETALRVPGEARFGLLSAWASTALQPKAVIAHAEVDAEAVGPVLRLRARQDGDRFQPQGMSETKKLQDFFVDAHVPRNQRDAIPLFVNQRGIVWVGGLRIAEWAKPRPGCPTIHLSYTAC